MTSGVPGDGSSSLGWTSTYFALKDWPGAPATGLCGCGGWLGTKHAEVGYIVGSNTRPALRRHLRQPALRRRLVLPKGIEK